MINFLDHFLQGFDFDPFESKALAGVNGSGEEKEESRKGILLILHNEYMKLNNVGLIDK